MLGWEIVFGIVTFISMILGVASIGYAIKTNREKIRLERLVKGTTASIAGSIERIRRRSHLADSHCRNIVSECGNLPLEDHISNIVSHALGGARDSVATYDGLGHVLNHVFALQEGLFETRLVEHPDIRTFSDEPERR